MGVPCHVFCPQSFNVSHAAPGWDCRDVISARSQSWSDTRCSCQHWPAGIKMLIAWWWARGCHLCRLLQFKYVKNMKFSRCTHLEPEPETLCYCPCVSRCSSRALILPIDLLRVGPRCGELVPHAMCMYWLSTANLTIIRRYVFNTVCGTKYTVRYGTYPCIQTVPPCFGMLRLTMMMCVSELI